MCHFLSITFSSIKEKQMNAMYMDLFRNLKLILPIEHIYDKGK